MSDEMKMIMETFRHFAKENKQREIPEDEMKAMLAQAMKGLKIANMNESDKFFKGMLAGGFMAVAPLIFGAYAQHTQDVERYRAAAAQAAEDLSSTKTKVAELDKQVNNNPSAWQWSDDTVESPATGEKHAHPTSTERFPTADFDKDGEPDAVILSPSWSIAMQVLQDKQAGTINVPGYPEGEVPEVSLIVDVLSHSANKDPGGASFTFAEDFGDYLINTGDMGAGDIQMIGGIHPGNTVAVNPVVFEDQPDYVFPDSGLTAQQTYIKYFFKYLGSEEALKYGGAI
tara:strand:- start:125 stop:982 length:858 start_codon:yes stop_codon:yes gene_type:complete